MTYIPVKLTMNAVLSPAPAPTVMAQTLIFVDDHPLYREGLRRTLQDAMPQLRVLDAADGKTALALLKAFPDTDLLLVDYRLGNDNGLALLEKISVRFPMVARGLLCSTPSSDVAARAQAMGCVACLSKDRNEASLKQALEKLFDGRTVFDVQPTPTAESRLSSKRLEILRLAARGLTNTDIGRMMELSERAVKDHWTHIFLQLDASSRAEAVSRAQNAQLL